MTSIEITDIKHFMKALLMDQTLDNLLVTEVSISTSNNFNIDGRINHSFYSSEELSELPNTDFSYWSTLRPICFNLIKGRKTPLKFKMVFKLDENSINSLLDKSGLSYVYNDIIGLFLNISYEDGKLFCITGTSLRTFTMDKSLEKYFDEYATKKINSI